MDKSKFDHVIDSPPGPRGEVHDWHGQRVAVIGTDAIMDSMLVVENDCGDCMAVYKSIVKPAPPEPLVVWVSRDMLNELQHGHHETMNVHRNPWPGGIPLTITAESLAAAEKEAGK